MLTRWRVEARDRLAYGAIGRLLRQIAGRVALLLSFSASNRIIRETALLRLLGNGRRRLLLSSRVRRRIAGDPAGVVRAHRERRGPGQDGLPATRTTVLKAPGAAGERGVIYSAFEYNWIRIVESVDPLPELVRDYDIIWATSWSPTDYLDLARLLASTRLDQPAVLGTSAAEEPVYVQASNFSELPALEAFHPRVRVVPNLLCEYLDPASFDAMPADARDIDLLVVSNWAPFKRHFELFRALREMPTDLRVVCVGQPERGHTLAMIRDLAAAYRVPQQIEFLESLPLVEVRALQARARAAAIFSLREGSCVAAVEALFAGASLGLMEGAHVGSTAYLNPSTGLSLRAGHVADDLKRLIGEAPLRAPRQWALDHLGAERATAALNQWLAERAVERGLPWTTDIARLAWSPYPWVGDPAARSALEPAAASLHQRFPGAFGSDLLDASRY